MAVNLPPLALAYLGDAVFELYVREKIITQSNLGINDLNRLARKYVNAEAQGAMYHKILPHLTKEEADVIKRGRNAKSGNAPKSAAMSDYRHATGLESLFGYLYLQGENERLNWLFEICVELP
jgi:ribonuclease-3 family protein